MTRLAAGFLAGGVALYLLGSYTQIGWFFLFDALVWSIIVVSALLPRWSLSRLAVRRHVRLLASPVPASAVSPCEGDAVEVGLSVTNRGRLPRYFVKVVERTLLEDPSQGPRAFFLPVLPARGEVTLAYTALCYRRGRYRNASVTLETGAPFGLFIARRRLELPLSLTVYPTFYSLGALPEAARDDGQGQGTSATAPSAEMYGSREHQRGDSLRYVHWRNTARRGQFMVKQFEEPRPRALAVALPLRHVWGTGKETTLEYSVKIAASLAMKCREVGATITILGEQPQPPGEATWREAMEHLAGVEAIGGTTTPDGLIPPGGMTNATLVVIVPAAEPDHIPRLLELAQQSRHVGMVVVLLEGFVEGEEPLQFVARLNGGSVTLVRCARGNLEAAVRALGALSPAASSFRRG